MFIGKWEREGREQVLVCTLQVYQAWTSSGSNLKKDQELATKTAMV